eukprot:TRINITY_DN13820_c0_g1_i1.p1 TRINITY_DN13820_c0_g1~~TRINITY_DN13820_c0_g1_i1.p1  ORF type:complete len:426 (+),score=123.51 TRINITY_DN13820_c0_g1_i1:44-1321(+)
MFKKSKISKNHFTKIFNRLAYINKNNFCTVNTNQKIIHSYQNDDTFGEIQAINQYSFDKKNIRCLILSTSGDLAISLASLPNVLSVDSVDSNFSQHSLSELRRSSVKNLNYNEFLTFNGINSSQEKIDQEKEKRNQLFNQKIVNDLNIDVRAYWQERINEITDGLFYSGLFQKLESKISEKLSQNGFKELIDNQSTNVTKDTLEDLKKWNNDLRSLWEEFEREIGNKEIARRFLSTNYLERIQVLKKTSPNNPFLQRLTRGFFDVENLPHAFTADTFQKAKSNGIDQSRIRFHQGQIDQIGSVYKSFMYPQGFDFISISNSTDFESAEESRKKIGKLLPLLSKGGIIVGKLGFNVDLSIRKTFEKWFEVSTSINGKIRHSERSVWGSAKEFVVAQKNWDQLIQLNYEHGYNNVPPPTPDYSKIAD